MIGLNDACVEVVRKQRKPAGLAKLYHLERFVRNWRRATRVERIECRRHHLKNDVLSQFTEKQILTAVGLAFAGMGEGEFADLPLSQLAAAAQRKLEGRSVIDFIFECADFEEGIRLAIGRLNYDKPLIKNDLYIV